MVYRSQGRCDVTSLKIHWDWHNVMPTSMYLQGNDMMSLQSKTGYIYIYEPNLSNFFHSSDSKSMSCSLSKKKNQASYYLSYCSMSAFLWAEFFLMAKSWGTNSVIILRVLCSIILLSHVLFQPHEKKSNPKVIKLFFMLNSAEHEIYLANKY